MNGRVVLGASILLALQACSRERPPPSAPPYPQAAAIASGGVYSDCAACHGAAGEGRLGPALKGDAHLAQTDYAIAKVLHGSATMPGFSSQLSDAEVAKVVTTIRTQWGNSFGKVNPSDVARLRSTADAAVVGAAVGAGG